MQIVYIHQINSRVESLQCGCMPAKLLRSVIESQYLEINLKLNSV